LSDDFASALTFVEGYNTSSSKLFSTRGFAVLSPGQQLRRYRLWLPRLWIRWKHLMDIGHLVWTRPGPDRPDSPRAQWWGSVVVNMLIALLALWRSGSDGVAAAGVNSAALVAVPLMVGLFLGARWAAMRCAAARRGLALRFRAWETGFLVSLVVALVFAFYFPIPGGAYPAGGQWSYRGSLPALGSMALAGVLPTLLLTGAALGLLWFADLPSDVAGWIGYALFVAAPLALFDTVMVFFPFISFGGRLIRDWNRPVWFVVAGVALAEFLVWAYA
jgi:hypothetical protein